MITKKMKAILIDVHNQSVREVEVNSIDGSCLDSIYKSLGCYTIALAPTEGLSDGDDLFVDDNGLLTLTDNTKFFEMEGGRQPFAGNGLITGSDDDGNTQDAMTNIDVVRSRVKFLSMSDVREKYYMRDC